MSLKEHWCSWEAKYHAIFKRSTKVVVLSRHYVARLLISAGNSSGNVDFPISFYKFTIPAPFKICFDSYIFVNMFKLRKVWSLFSNLRLRYLHILEIVLFIAKNRPQSEFIKPYFATHTVYEKKIYNGWAIILQNITEP